ncbi:hypothetical protein [Nocardia transvalensis]|uniref:hypothetical protein n=1 Tax=Nocardia transvalensis TaxID=37333 RepID=UPI0018939A3C|nr:hypothetical protein [Nocardia transvalensis]MBF6328829.1 hypothetical protein [Nocardia transvalensis]
MMSHHPATQRRTTRRPAQILQHTAIVLAGMASIGLTVAAGTYIVNQMAETGHVPGTDFALPGLAPDVPAPAREPGDHELPGAAPVTGAVGLVAETRALPVTVVDRRPEAPDPPLARPAPATASVTGVPQTNTSALRLRLPGDTYVGANVVRDQPNSISMSVDTNVFTTVATALSEQLGEQPDPATRSSGVSQLRTDIDTRNGEITVAVSDPMLGNQSMHLSRPTGAVQDDRTRADGISV